MTKHGKSYNVVEAQLDREKLYDPTEAIDILVSNKSLNFDQAATAMEEIMSGAATPGDEAMRNEEDSRMR